MTIPYDLSTRVADLLRQVAAQIVVPRFRHLRAGDISEKEPGETVTIVDREAEAALTRDLLRLLPGSRVVGEEASGLDPALLTGLDSGLVWLVDPLDGTANFAAGKAEFSLMIALLRDGETIASWILDPLAERLATAEAGAGAFVDGQRVVLVRHADAITKLHGVVKTRFLPDAFKVALDPQSPGLPTLHPGTGSAGLDYPALAAGRWQFLLYWRTLAWDHAPGVLFIREAGAHVARLDGSPYRADDPRTGLLIASDARIWSGIRALLPS